MEYTFNDNVPKKEFDMFVKNNKHVSFMQDYSWSYVKSNFSPIFCGLYKKDKLVATAVLLIRKIGLNIKFGYVPRGYLLDYSNKEILNEMTKSIKLLGKKHGLYNIKIDPNYCLKEHNKKHDLIIDDTLTSHHKIIHQNLLSCGYKHNKLYLSIKKSNQPRFNMMVPLYDNDKNIIDRKNLKNLYKRSTKVLFPNFFAKRGVYYEKTKDLACLEEFVKVIHETEKRQGLRLRDKKYFQTIIENLNSYLVFGKLNLTEYKAFLEANKGSEEDINLVNEMLKKQSIITLSAALLVMPVNNSGLKISEYLYAGNSLLFKKLRVSEGLVNYLCEISIDNQCHYCNLGGVDGSLEDHLSKFKLNFGSNITEHIGEYDLIINKFIYYPITILLPLLKKIYGKIKR